MAIIKQYHKDTNTTYVYESVSCWDAEKGQSRSKRKLLGKIDPLTGEVVPTGKRGRSKKNPQASGTAPGQSVAERDSNTLLLDALARNQELESTIREQKVKLDELARKNAKLTAALEKLCTSLGKCIDACRSCQE